jgi:hypothetical protein
MLFLEEAITTILSDFKGSILKLWNDFFEGKTTIDLQRIKLNSSKKDFSILNTKLMDYLEEESNFSVKDVNGGERFLDYTGLLNEK